MIGNREGWICPKCQRGVSPDEKHCDCAVAAISTIGIPIGPAPTTPDTNPWPAWDPRKGLTGSVVLAKDDGTTIWNGFAWQKQEFTQ